MQEGVGPRARLPETMTASGHPPDHTFRVPTFYDAIEIALMTFKHIIKAYEPSS